MTSPLTRKMKVMTTCDKIWLINLSFKCHSISPSRFKCCSLSLDWTTRMLLKQFSILQTVTNKEIGQVLWRNMAFRMQLNLFRRHEANLPFLKHQLQSKPSCNFKFLINRIWESPFKIWEFRSRWPSHLCVPLK